MTAGMDVSTGNFNGYPPKLMVKFRGCSNYIDVVGGSKMLPLYNLINKYHLNSLD